MDFITDNLIIILIIASGIAKFVTSLKEKKPDPRSERPLEDQLSSEELEEFLEEAERRHYEPVVPPPLPRAGTTPPLHKAGTSAPPQMERSPVPTLKKANQAGVENKPSVGAARYQQEVMQEELARQVAIAEQLSGLKQARKKQEPPQTTLREPSTPVSSGSIRDRLKNRSELRQAFVLKEFLEKPVGLR